MKIFGRSRKTAAEALKARANQGPRFVSAQTDEANELYLYDVIGNGWFGGISAKSIVEAMRGFDRKKALNIFVNSPGGDVFEGSAIYSALARFDGTKRVYVDGLAASAASFIALVGDEVITSAQAMWMIHNPWTVAIGDYNDMAKAAKDLEKVATVYREAYAKKCGKSIADITKAMDETTWLTAKEALEYGLTDKVSNDMGCNCDGPCGDDCPCGGECTDACECDCEKTDALSQSSSVAVSILARYKKAPAAVKPSVDDMIASMEKRFKNLPTRASPQRPMTPGQPGSKRAQ